MTATRLIAYSFALSNEEETLRHRHIRHCPLKSEKEHPSPIQSGHDLEWTHAGRCPVPGVD